MRIPALSEGAGVLIAGPVNNPPTAELAPAETSPIPRRMCKLKPASHINRKRKTFMSNSYGYIEVKLLKMEGWNLSTSGGCAGGAGLVVTSDEWRGRRRRIQSW